MTQASGLKWKVTARIYRGEVKGWSALKGGKRYSISKVYNETQGSHYNLSINGLFITKSYNVNDLKAIANTLSKEVTQ